MPMSTMAVVTDSKVRAVHRDRSACVYIRQSTLQQVRSNVESTERQYALVEKAVGLGWSRDQVEVFDQDLGCSGAQAAGREGFQLLVARVSMAEVGAVFGLEVSRLARSSADWHRLLELCALFDTLIVDGDGIYDLAEFNDRLVLGMKGTMSEAELHLLRSRMLGGKRNKAEKGELRFPLPVGYIHDEDGAVVKDPDEEIQEAVAGVFASFRRTGSAYGTVKAMAEHPFPKRAYGGIWAGKIRWGRLTHGRVLSILKNPAYAGAYAFGRHRSEKRVGENGRLFERTVLLPMEEWRVLIESHHAGYIKWGEYLENQRQLAANRTNGPEHAVPGPAREGRALLQGLVICGGCGHRLSARYAGNGGIYPQYECKSARRQGLAAEPGCRSIRTDLVDDVVVERVLATLTPGHLELAAKAMEELEERHQAERRRWEQRIERARYEVERAERQYEVCEPENRLVARTLETRWNGRLAELAQVEQDMEAQEREWRRRQAPPAEQVLAIAEDLPRLWSAPSTSSADRKRILRVVIEDVTVRSEPKGPEVELGLRWRGGASETVSVQRRRPIAERVKTPPALIAAIRELATEYMDDEIAAQLKGRGLMSGKSRPVTRSAVRWIRHRYTIPGPPRYRDGAVSVKAVAQRFGVTTGVVYYWINHGVLPANKRAPGWPLEIHLDAGTEIRLRDWVATSSRIKNGSDSPSHAARSAV